METETLLHVQSTQLNASKDPENLHNYTSKDLLYSKDQLERPEHICHNQLNFSDIAPFLTISAFDGNWIGQLKQSILGYGMYRIQKILLYTLTSSSDKISMVIQ